MRTGLRILIVVGLMVFGVALADEASASFTGGSRLLYYFTQTAFEPGAATGTALTIFTVSNNGTTSVNARYMIYRGSDCTRTGPTSLTLAAGETKLIDVSTLVTYPSGVIDLWASTPGGTPIRWDFLTGKSVIVDFGSATATSAVVPAMKLFSDDRTKTDQSAIPDENLAQEFAPFTIVGDFFPNSASITDTIALFTPAIQPGAVPPPSTGSAAHGANYYTLGGTKTVLTPLSTSCVYSNTLATAIGPLSSGGGKIEVSNGGAAKGLAGWKFTKIHVSSVTLLFGELLTSTIALINTATTQ